MIHITLPIEPIARVVVNVSRSGAAPSAFDTGLLLIRDAAFADSRRLAEVSSSAGAAAQLAEWGFGPASAPYAAAVKYFGASPAPFRLLLSCYPASETLPEAVSAVLDLTPAFYGIAFGQEEADERILALDAALSAMTRQLVAFVPVTGDPDAAAAAGSLLRRLHEAGSDHAVPFFCAGVADAAALMGAAMGLTASHTSSAFSLCYKRLNGVLPSDLTESQAAAIESRGGNVYVTRGYTHHLLEKGTLASGLRYDEKLYLDMIAADLREAAVALLAENPDRLPQTDDTTAQFMNRFTAILSGYADRGILASGLWRGADAGPLVNGEPVENGFVLWADSYDDQSDADRAAHKAVPVQAGLVLAGSVESIVIAVNVVV